MNKSYKSNSSLLSGTASWHWIAYMSIHDELYAYNPMSLDRMDVRLAILGMIKLLPDISCPAVLFFFIIIATKHCFFIFFSHTL